MAQRLKLSLYATQYDNCNCRNWDGVVRGRKVWHCTCPRSNGPSLAWRGERQERNVQRRRFCFIHGLIYASLKAQRDRMILLVWDSIEISSVQCMITTKSLSSSVTCICLIHSVCLWEWPGQRCLALVFIEMKQHAHYEGTGLQLVQVVLETGVFRFLNR